jgi:hypothetical protein
MHKVRLRDVDSLVIIEPKFGSFPVPTDSARFGLHAFDSVDII